MSFWLHYCEGSIRRSTDFRQPLARQQSEQFETEEEALSRARRILEDGRYRTVFLRHGNKTLFNEPRLKLRLCRA